jgi:RNA recognition motif-containing protein
VFASVSIDKNTGKSKNCGIVQFETPSMAKEAIREMRNYPMNGATLYVREDVQESKQREGSRVGRGKNNDDRYEIDTRAQTKSKSSIPTEWKRANDNDIDGEGDMWYDLKDDELKEIESIIQKRDGQRRQNNYKMSDKLREKLKDDFGVHLDDRLKLWWTDTKHGGVPRSVSDIKGEGRWGNLKPWRQIPTNPKSDAMVDSDHVMQLLSKRDRARKKKDFKTADDLLQNAYSAPKGGLTLRIHDESRTWRIWTEAPPQKKGETPAGYEKLTPVDMCLQIVEENEPDKVDEMRELLKKFPGREWSIFKRLKGRYDISE